MNYYNTDMCKFESSQKDETRLQSADSSNAYRKPTRDFNFLQIVSFFGVSD